VAQQACLVCGRQLCDDHHLRFAQNRALSRKVSDEFTFHYAADITASSIVMVMKRPMASAASATPGAWTELLRKIGRNDLRR